MVGGLRDLLQCVDKQVAAIRKRCQALRLAPHPAPRPCISYPRRIAAAAKKKGDPKYRATLVDGLLGPGLAISRFQWARVLDLFGHAGRLHCV